MLTSSNLTKAFVQWRHGEHTVACSRNLLIDHVNYSKLILKYYCNRREIYLVRRSKIIFWNARIHMFRMREVRIIW